VLKIVVDGSSRTGHDESGLLGSGDGGAAAWRGGEWSAGVTQWGVAARHGGEWSAGVTRWGAAARRGGEWRWWSAA
jgi:hypothetical protein